MEGPVNLLKCKLRHADRRLKTSCGCWCRGAPQGVCLSNSDWETENPKSRQRGNVVELLIAVQIIWLGCWIVAAADHVL